jgi:HK97 family phage prohead protease
MSELETRELELRLENQEDRTFTGIAVPFNQTANIGGRYLERFAPGAIESITDTMVFYGHETPIGKIIRGEDTEDGFLVTGRISETQLGNETLTLMRDGVLKKMSIGFRPIEQTVEGNTVTRTKVDAVEISIVAVPAYSAAKITEVRESEISGTPEENNLTESEGAVMEDLSLDVASVKDGLETLERKFEAIATPAVPAANPALKFRSYGEYVQAFAKGDEDAVTLMRTYASATSADTYAAPGFVGFINTLVENNRPTLNAFTRAALPAAGLTVEYAKITANDTEVEDQSAENGALALGNLEIGSASANVITVGGGSEMSRQTVERSSVPYLDTVFRALATNYAKATNAKATAVVAGLSYTGKTFDADGGTAASIIEGITGGAAYIGEKTGLQAEFLLVSADVYTLLIKTVAGDGRPIINVDGAGVNNIGSGSVPALSGSVFGGIQIITDFSLATGSAYLANSAAITVWESAGAPLQLTQSNEKTLTDYVGVYGYVAAAATWPDAIVKLDVTA